MESRLFSNTLPNVKTKQSSGDWFLLAVISLIKRLTHHAKKIRIELFIRCSERNNGFKKSAF